MSRRFSSLVMLTLTLWMLFSLWRALPAEMQSTATVS
jgi:hypothetical protein